jgi:hypothetical protein
VIHKLILVTQEMGKAVDVMAQKSRHEVKWTLAIAGEKRR